MALTVPTFLVRHGQYDRSTGLLTDEGRIDMERAYKSLVRHAVGERALILCSNAPRAIQSADELAKHLSTVEPLQDGELQQHGNFPIRLASLDGLLEQIVERGGIDLGNHDSLVVVTHAPLVSLATTHNLRAKPDDVPYGAVYPYEPGSWIEPRQLL